jgi:hypothetical protein
MRRALRIWLKIVFLGAALVFSLTACQKKKAPEQVATVDRVGSSPLGTSQAILNKTFTVHTSVAFPFEIPAHAAMPRLRGAYKSYVGKVGIKSDDAANVDFFVLTEEQYPDFANGRASETLFSADAAHEQNVDVSLPPSMNEPKKFYLVFRNTPGGDSKEVVQADLSVDF